MKVLVVGGGGREHAICWKLAQSPKVTQLYCAPGNAGIAQLARCVPIPATDVSGMVAWAKENAMDYVMVAPDDPLALGMVDALAEAGIPAFGPRKNAAVIEASKAFSKELMKKYRIPTARHETFTDLDAALAYAAEQGAPIVVKADGLALGKGVVVAQTVEEAKTAIREMMADKKFGDSGSTVVIEARRSPCWPSATGSTWSLCPPARTTSGPMTATRAPTPEEWGPSPPPPTTPRGSPPSAWRRFFCPPWRH